MRPSIPDASTCYRAVSSRDRRFDGVFYTAVTTTGIYCRPSCPARTPAPANVAFYPTAAAAQAAGFRACKRCLPDATPGSPSWDVQASTAGRAMRLIADGVVDREGVPGLAAHLGYTPRHLTRVLTAELGAGPLALARAGGAQTARSLIAATALSFGEIAFAGGFDSVRQFNDTIRAVYGTTPSELRGRRRDAGTVPSRTVATPLSATGREESRRGPRQRDEDQRAGSRSGQPAAAAPGTIRLRLAVRTPFHGSGLRRFLAPRALPGVEAVGDGWYARTLRLPYAPGTIRLELPDLPEPGTATVAVELALGDLRDIAAAVERAGRLLDADCDPLAVADALGPDPVLGPLLRRWPGLRLPGHVDGAEVAVRAVVGQQISVAGARTILGRLIQRYGEPLPGYVMCRPSSPTETGQHRAFADTIHATGRHRPVSAPDETAATPELTHLFPDAAALAALDPEDLPMPRARGRALIGLCRALASGELALDRGPDRQQTRERLLALPGIGDWTASYLAIRALGDPDAFMPTDLGTRQALARLGRDPRQAAALAENWRPWRSYAQTLLWQFILPDPEGTPDVARD